MLLILCLIFILIFVLLLRRKLRLLGLGRFQFAKTIQHNQQRYYIEEVVFADRQQAIHGYFRLVPMLQQYGNVLESEYDFFDFYSVVLRFEDCSMKLVRRLNYVRLIKSEKPVAISDFEQRLSGSINITFLLLG